MSIHKWIHDTKLFYSTEKSFFQMWSLSPYWRHDPRNQKHRKKANMARKKAISFGSTSISTLEFA